MKQAIIYFMILTLSLAGSTGGFAQELKGQETGLYNDIFSQNIYYEGTQVLRLNRLYRMLFNKKVHSGNVNIFDEVADSEFFVNRHSRTRMSAQQLQEGQKETSGPQGVLTIYKGKSEGLHPGFFVTDEKGDKYLLKFDDYDHLEMTTGAEVVASRFYHAIGYHVPQYTIATFAQDQLQVGPNAKVVDKTGFKKPFTAERLEEFLLFVPRDNDGNFRASASKMLSGDYKGYWSFLTNRWGDKSDKVIHQDRREIRTLAIFSAWLNNYDVRESNTLDVVVDENGEKKLRHYLLDFSATLGAGADGQKPPMFAHEHMFDYGEAFKAFVSLGLWEKPWQKRWDEAQTNGYFSPAVGYFDNIYFDPGKFKTQLPHYAFKNLTRADGLWAAKIIRSFSDEDIRAMVSSGKFSQQEDAEYIAKILIERRDLIARYWFEKSSALDNFQYKGGILTFEDLSAKYGFQPSEGLQYQVDVIKKNGGKGEKAASLNLSQASVSVDADWFAGADSIDLLIKTTHAGVEKPNPYVVVTLGSGQILRIAHQD